MKEQKRQEEFNQRQKELNYAIDQLFSQFSAVAETVNNSLIDEKISYRPTIVPSNAAASTFRLSFMGRTMTVSFFNHDIVPNYLAGYKKRQIDFQVQRHGFVMQTPTLEYLEKDNAYFLGKAEINFGRNGTNFGFNVPLRKQSPDDIYGEWWMGKFSHTPIFSNYVNGLYFAFEPMKFFEEYEYGRGNVMHLNEMKYKKVEDNDIADLIEKMTL